MEKEVKILYSYNHLLRKSFIQKKEAKRKYKRKKQNIKKRGRIFVTHEIGENIVQLQPSSQKTLHPYFISIIMFPISSIKDLLDLWYRMFENAMW